MGTNHQGCVYPENIRLCWDVPRRKPFVSVIEGGYKGQIVDVCLFYVLLTLQSRCNRIRCPLARMSGLQCFNMGHNGHGINLYGVSMTLMVN